MFTRNSRKSGLIILATFYAAFVYAVDLGPITAKLRDSYLQRAQVWHATKVEKMNILSGPKSNVSVRFEALVTCRYVEPTKPPGGGTPKFKCRLPSGEILRVKYGKESREIFADVAATRLFWALGFYADEIYPARIRCLECPEMNPFQPSAEERRIDRIIEDAVFERNFPGVIIEEKEDQGWGWQELEKVDPKAGGATRAQIDALKLLAVFIQHSDSPAHQQRLACYKQDVKSGGRYGVGFCLRPILMIADPGGSFGRGTSILTDQQKMDLQRWKSVHIWNHAEENHILRQHKRRACIGNLTRSIGSGDAGLSNPEISEQGRKFLSERLNRLSMKQIQDLFRVARVSKRAQQIVENGVTRVITVEDWSAVFIQKRKEISDRSCPVLVD